MMRISPFRTFLENMAKGASAGFVLLALLGTVLIPFRMATVHFDGSAHNLAVKRNHFWYMMAGRQPATRDPIGRLALDIRAYQGLPVPAGTRRVIRDTYYCREGTYPGLDSDLHWTMLFSGLNGGFVSDMLSKNLQTISKEGAGSLVRAPLQPPLPISDDKIVACNASIEATNRLWRMVAGDAPLDATSEGRLASDLRVLIRQKRPSPPYEIHPYCPYQAYADAEHGLGYDLFYSSGFIHGDFLRKARECTHGNLAAVIRPVPALPRWDEVNVFGKRIYVCSPASIAVMILILLVCGASGTSNLSEVIAEIRHPYRRERRIAWRTLARLDRIKDKTEDEKKQACQAEEILAATPPPEPQLGIPDAPDRAEEHALDELNLAHARVTAERDLVTQKAGTQ